jgi:hypothetical protein
MSSVIWSRPGHPAAEADPLAGVLARGPAGSPYWPDATEAAERLIAACIRQLEERGVSSRGANGELRGDLERFVFLLGGGDGESLFSLPGESPAR